MSRNAKNQNMVSCRNDMSLLPNLTKKKTNPFHVTAVFLYPLKTSENQRFSDVFWGYRKKSVHEVGYKNPF